MTRAPIRLLSATVVLGLAVTGALALVAPPSQAVPGAHKFAGTGFGAIPDGSSPCPTPGAPRNVTFNVTGMTAPLTDVRITGLQFDPAHPFLGDLSVSLIAPNGATHVVFARTGATTAAGFGDTSNVSGPYTFADDAAGNWWTAAAAVDSNTNVAPGSYRTSQSGGAGATGAVSSMNAAFAALANPNGTWTLRVTDGCAGDTGAVTAATLELTDPTACATQQAAVSSAATAAASADQAAAAAGDAVAKATKKVTKAKQRLKKAVRSGAQGKIAKAKAKLKKAKKAAKAAKAAKAVADQGAATAHQQLAAAQAALAACQQA
jgi:subtilisin-like proprotein convertase family protein